MNASLGEVCPTSAPDGTSSKLATATPATRRRAAAAVSKRFNYCRSLGCRAPVPSEESFPKAASERTVTDTAVLHDRRPARLKSTGFTGAVFRRGGSCLCIYDDHGQTHNVTALCNLLLDYGKTNGLQLEDFFYEDVILDDLSVDGYSSYMIKLSVMLQENDETVKRKNLSLRESPRAKAQPPLENYLYNRSDLPLLRADAFPHLLRYAEMSFSLSDNG